MKSTPTLFIIVLLDFSFCEVDVPHHISILSPRSDVQQPAGQDLVVKYVVEHEARCSVVAILNGKLIRVVPSCRLSFAVDADDLLLGSNELELLLQSESDQSVDGSDSGPSKIVHFDVVEKPSWYTPRVDCADISEDGVCDQCIHSVNGICIVRNATTVYSIPRIFHWVWVGGGGPIPSRFDGYMASWRNLHPDWQFIIWTDELVTWPLRNAALVAQADSYAGSIHSHRSIAATS